MKIYIQDRKGYLMTRINTFLQKNNLEVDLVFIKDEDFVVLDEFDFFLVINNLDDFYFFVSNYRFFEEYKLIVVDYLVSKELKKNKITFYSFKHFCEYLKEY